MDQKYIVNRFLTIPLSAIFYWSDQIALINISDTMHFKPMQALIQWLSLIRDEDGSNFKMELGLILISTNKYTVESLWEVLDRKLLEALSFKTRQIR
jgi:hypothetical protein